MQPKASASRGNFGPPWVWTVTDASSSPWVRRTSTAAAFPGEVFAGEVARLGSAADPVTRTFEVESRLRNPGLRLRPGLIVSLRIILGRKGGLVIPAEAVVDETDGRGVAWVARDGSVRRREITLGQRLDREVEVLAGLAEGAQVVVVGKRGLIDGQAVESYD